MHGCPRGIWGDRRISNAQFRCLVCLLGYADQSGYCNPSLRVMARDLSRTRSTIRHHLNGLVVLGIITRDPMPRRYGSRGANRYCVARLRCVATDPVPADQPTVAAAADHTPPTPVTQPALLLPRNGGNRHSASRPERNIPPPPARRHRARGSPNLIAQTALAVMRNG
jgi:hypothetical protein